MPGITPFLASAMPQDPVWQMERALVSKLLADGPQPLLTLQCMDLFIPPFLSKFKNESKVGAGRTSACLRPNLAPAGHRLLPLRAARRPCMIGT